MKLEGARRDVLAALPGWVVARVVVLLSLAAANLIARHLKPIPGHVAAHLHEGILGWDAVRYQQIAERGYQALPIKEIRFFPLYPLLARAVGFVIGHRAGIALVLIANLCALALGALVHRIVRMEGGDDETAVRAAWLVALVPAAFVFVWGYSEALAMALTAAGFLALRRQAWWWAAAAGFLGGLTRPVGLVFMLPAAIEAARGLHRGQLRLGDLAARAAAVGSSAVGCGVYLLWVGHVFGDALLPFRIQRNPLYRGPATNPFPVMWGAIENAFQGAWRGNSLHLPWVVIVLVLVVLVFRFMPFSYGAYAAAMVVIALTAQRWGSFERYAFTAFPITIALAWVTRNRHAERAAWAIGVTAMAGYATLAVLGAYVP
ncbi:MAG TPA: mannosyltransferase family protein [Acidimicrobiales bacterium]|nr:mannosyltransferase family protein [Acidimicrobiales bacterium]